MQTQFAKTLLSTLALVGFASEAAALDFNGYFRAGPGLTSSNASRACYTLPVAGGKYRLGNECDFYGEFAFSQSGKSGDVDYKALLMVNSFNPGTDAGASKLGINQLFVEGKGFDFAPQQTFWVGPRFNRTEVYFIDTKFTQIEDTGAGVKGIPIGGANLALSYYHTDGSTDKPGDLLNADLSGLGLNPGGSLRFMLSAVKGRFTGGTSGVAFTVLHEQKDILGAGSSNSLWLQTSQGAAGLNTGFGNLAAPSSTKGMRIADSLGWQSGNFGGAVVALYESSKDAGVTTKATSFGGRLSYGVTKNFKLLGEAGTTSIKVGSAPEARLTKFTFAPTISVGPGFYDRPDLRLYVTKATWNAAAGNVTGYGGKAPNAAFNGKTSGTSVGAQVEMWF